MIPENRSMSAENRALTSIASTQRSIHLGETFALWVSMIGANARLYEYVVPFGIVCCSAVLLFTNLPSQIGVPPRSDLVRVNEPIEVPGSWYQEPYEERREPARAH